MRLNLLLAEDNLPDALLIRQSIRMADLPLEVHHVSDGEKAIQFITKAETEPDPPWPDVILLDLNLPKVEGFEFLRWLRSRARGKGIPVIVITSSDSPADRRDSSDLGAGYFRKPANYDEFLKMGSVLKDFLRNKGVL